VVIPTPLGNARFKKHERIIIKAHFLLRITQENVLLHSLKSYIHVASLKINITLIFLLSHPQENVL
jgi:hypothetical protein